METIIETKVCRVCRNSLASEAFPVDRGQAIDGLFRCKLCSKANETISKQLHYSRNKQQIKQRSIRFHAARQTEWNEYLQTKYGNPKCELCNKDLEWPNRNKSKSVHFDHKHEGQEQIYDQPSKWMRVRYCTPENIAIFESCGFGILCNTCNRMLPTMNRQEWITKLVQYART